MTSRYSKKLLQDVQQFMVDESSVAHQLFHHLLSLDRKFLLRSDLMDAFEQVCLNEKQLCQPDSALARMIQHSQEAAMNHAWVYFALRTRIGRWLYLKVHVDTMDVSRIAVSEFLNFKEQLVANEPTNPWLLEVDLEPFSREFYKLQESDSIGRGVEFLNRKLSSQIFEAHGGSQHIFNFLRVHTYKNQQLMLNDKIEDIAELQNALRQADKVLRQHDDDTPWSEVYPVLQSFGFEPGWGNNIRQTRRTMRLLLDILEAPSPGNLEHFLSQIPMIFSIAILSPHGFFGQSNVLGRPDTGGQVVYILDQVRALEKEMHLRLQSQGLENIDPQVTVITRLIPEAEGTTCNQAREKIAGTRNAMILRVPFRNPQGEIIPQWISRFEIWPYLESFAIDAEVEILACLGGRPDLIVGNYSDGNLVASLMSRRLKVTQCNIAHALEKTKYLYSDLYWRENEAQYHFSCQFTADLIAMNSADFIITSTYQEIAGTDDALGQYESYTSFTMPDLYRVVQGIDVYDPKFNIVSPGADPDVYFPASDEERRLKHLHAEMHELVYGPVNDDQRRGVLARTDRPLILTMARMDHIKNITGLVRWYAESPELREQCNLLVISGHVNPERSTDTEEKNQIQLMHDLMDRYQLDGEVRWLGMHLEKKLAGELYRFVADLKGVFVQPALFEAFGLTVIEAMSSGLPTFATCFGGPMEIIEDGISGFHIDPNHGDRAAARIAGFFRECAQQPDYWERISRASLDRVQERYTWKNYAERMMTLSRVYGFWKYVSDLERAETHRYLDMFYALQYRPLASTLLP